MNKIHLSAKTFSLSPVAVPPVSPTKGLGARAPSSPARYAPASEKIDYTIILYNIINLLLTYILAIDKINLERLCALECFGVEPAQKAVNVQPLSGSQTSPSTRVNRVHTTGQHHVLEHSHGGQCSP